MMLPKVFPRAAMLLFLTGCGGVAFEDRPLNEAFLDVLGYDVNLRIDVSESRLVGEARITALAHGPTLSLSANVETVMEVGVEDAPATFEHSDGRLAISLPLSAPDTIRVRIRYVAVPREGLHLDTAQAYTFFHAPAWLPVHFDLRDRASLRLAVVAPEDWRVHAPGRLTGVVPTAGGSAETTWEVVEEFPAYLFGFVAGRMTEPMALPGRPDLLLVSGEVSGAARALRELRAMQRFFEERSGVPLPSDPYRQLFFTGAPAQEHATFALLPAGYLAAFARDSTEDYLLAHELAHEWWGNRVTAASWADFWLHEGIASFMVAAWKEQRWGVHAYAREVELASRRVAEWQRQHGARALVDSAFATHRTAGGPTPYNLGVVVLDRLRTELGDLAFWDGLRRFTQTGMQTRAVSTADLRAAMEEASGRSLLDFFQQWVYTAPATTLESGGPAV